MGYLVLKELLLQKRMFFLGFVYVLLFAFSFQGMGEGQLIAIISAVGYMFVMMGGAWEETNKSDMLWNSLPAPRWKIVGAKYISIPVYVLIVLAIYWIMSTILSLLRLPIAAVPLDLVSAILGLTAVFMAASLYYPVYFAVGYTKARYWHFILLIGIVVFGSALPSLFPEKPVWVVPLLESLPLVTGDVAILSTLGVFIAVFVGLSFLLSLRFYTRREF